MKEVVTVIVVRSSGEILLQLRDNGNGQEIAYPNTWSFPGGALEEGESSIQAAIREMEEEFELQLNPKDLELLWIYAYDTSNDSVFVCKLNTEPKLVLHEGADMQWFTLEQIKKMQLGFEHEKIIPHISKYFEELV